jgi:hypothetical protein
VAACPRQAISAVPPGPGAQGIIVITYTAAAAGAVVNLQSLRFNKALDRYLESALL